MASSSELTWLCFIIFISSVVCFADHSYTLPPQYVHTAVKSSFWISIGGYVVIAVLVIVFFGGVSLAAFLLCYCHEKATKKTRVQHMDLTSRAVLSQPPNWAKRLVVLPNLANQGFGIMSDGMQQVDTYHVIRHRNGEIFNDGARWAVPLSKGKHLFEIIWAWGQRGRHSSVGVGTQQASLKAKNSRSLVGKDIHSWGLDIVARRVYHQGRVVGGICPPDGSFIPDRFLMYVDMDNGKVGFGTDVSFWGYAITGLSTGGTLPLYVMASTDKWQAGIRIYYKGSEDPNGNSLQNDPSALMSTFAMPPPMAPAAPPAYSYIEVEPTTSDGRRSDVPPPPKVAVPFQPSDEVSPQAPPTYSPEEPQTPNNPSTTGREAPPQ